MKSAAVFVLGAVASFVAAKPTVYLIRHGEKPEKGDGLSEKGEQRAQCLRSIFGPGSPYNIGHVMAQTPKEDGKRQRPYLTVKPVAADLDLTVDLSCDRDDHDCVGDVVENYSGPGDILICWEHDNLNNVAEAIGGEDIKNYPDGAYDLIWTQPPPYDDVDESSQKCPGLD